MIFWTVAGSNTDASPPMKHSVRCSSAAASPPARASRLRSSSVGASASIAPECAAALTSGTNPPSFPDEAMVPAGAEHRGRERERVPALHVPGGGLGGDGPLHLSGEGDEPGARRARLHARVEDEQAPLPDVGHPGVLRVQLPVRGPGGVLAPVTVPEIEGVLSHGRSPPGPRAHAGAP